LDSAVDITEDATDDAFDNMSVTEHGSPGIVGILESRPPLNNFLSIPVRITARAALSAASVEIQIPEAFSKAVLTRGGNFDTSCIESVFCVVPRVGGVGFLVSVTNRVFAIAMSLSFS
jgi:hypothetical protein